MIAFSSSNRVLPRFLAGGTSTLSTSVATRSSTFHPGDNRGQPPTAPVGVIRDRAELHRPNCSISVRHGLPSRTTSPLASSTCRGFRGLLDPPGAPRYRGAVDRRLIIAGVVVLVLLLLTLLPALGFRLVAILAMLFELVLFLAFVAVVTLVVAVVWRAVNR